MAIDIKRWAWLGFITGIALPFITSFIAERIIPGLTVTFSALEATTVKPGIPEKTSELLLKYVTASSTLPDYLIAGIAGAIFVVVGAWLYSLKPIGRTAFMKVFLVLLYASLAFSAMTLFTLGLAAVLPVLLVASVNSFIVAWLIIALSKVKAVKIP